MYSRKRKERPEFEDAEARNPALFVVAHEADIIRGPHATLAAHSLEVVQYLPGHPPRRKTGDALIRWRPLPATHDSQEEIWVDRYDARLLLDALPPVQSLPGPPRAESPSGWSDLPSDAEDTFFFSPNEAEDYRREKRRRTLDKAYEERLKARMAEDEDEDEDEVEEHNIWGGSDEEPDDAQKELMRRTAIHLQSSPNPAQLEMRILANHGADKRFAFLRGRWSRAWRLIKGKVRLRTEEVANAPRNEANSSASLGALARYGDSDESESHDGEPEEQDIPACTGKDDAPHGIVDTDDASIRKARRARAKIWAENRRLARGSSS